MLAARERKAYFLHEFHSLGLKYIFVAYGISLIDYAEKQQTQWEDLENPS